MNRFSAHMVDFGAELFLQSTVIVPRMILVLYIEASACCDISPLLIRTLPARKLYHRRDLHKHSRGDC